MGDGTVWKNLLSRDPRKKEAVEQLRAAASMPGARCTLVMISKDGAEIRGDVLRGDTRRAVWINLDTGSRTVREGSTIPSKAMG